MVGNSGLLYDPRLLGGSDTNAIISAAMMSNKGMGSYGNMFNNGMHSFGIASAPNNTTSFSFLPGSATVPSLPALLPHHGNTSDLYTSSKRNSLGNGRSPPASPRARRSNEVGGVEKILDLIVYEQSELLFLDKSI